MKKNHVLENVVRNWRLDAMQEDEAYFFNTNAVADLLAGSKCYVIGRKGMGKSAICQHIVSKKKYNHFATKLTFKDFPFNEVYKLSDESYVSPNQYITLWKYLIYISVCRLMIDNNAVSNEARKKLKKLFPKSDIELLQYNLQKWTSNSFGIDIMGSGISYGGEFNEQKMPNWIECCTILESFILNNAGSANYYIVFDELDENYTSIISSNFKEKYIPLLTGLFKACQSVRSTFKSLPLNIKPIVFLRDDIYIQIQDSDKNKWSDFKIDIRWDQDTLKNMIAHRISVDASISGKRSLPFDIAWAEIFVPNIQLGYGFQQKRKTNAFHYITRNTQLRPRDLIFYIMAASRLALARNKHKITKEIIVDVDKEFSDYLLNEIIDEVTPILVNCRQILRIFSNTHKRVMRVEEFQREFEEAISSGEINCDMSCLQVLEILFNFSIIGNEHKSQSGQTFFKYQDSSYNFNKRDKILLHRGLLKALQVV